MVPDKIKFPRSESPKINKITSKTIQSQPLQHCIWSIMRRGMTRKTNLFITTRETAQVKILTPSSFVQEWNKRAPRNCKKHPIYGDSLNDFYQNEYLPEELSSIWLNFIIFLWPCSNSEIQIYVFAGIRLVATVTFKTRSVDCMPADYEAFKRNLNQINCKEKIIVSEILPCIPTYKLRPGGPFLIRGS